MRVISLLKILNQIEGIHVTETNMGFGAENNLTIHIENEDDYIKWRYFCKRLHAETDGIISAQKYPALTFRFPKNPEEAVESLEKVLKKKYYLIEEPEENYLTIIAKVTNLCNIDCQYCYDKPFREKLGHNGIITKEKLEKLIEMASKHAKDVTILWHGGEPSLAGSEYYRDIFENVFPKYPYCNFIDVSMQTNGTLLDEGFYNLHKDYGMGIGSSYNATQEDLRESKLENASHTEKDIFSVLDNIRQAKENDVSIGVIDVLTKENHPRVKEIYEFYKKADVDACFNEINAAGEATKHDFLFDDEESMKYYIKTTLDYFEYWMKDQSKDFFVDRYTSEYVSLITSAEGTVCHNGGRCVRHWLAINSNGDLYPCDRALPEKYRLGNVMEFNSIEEVYNTPHYQSFIAERKQKTKHCEKCSIYAYCKSGCPMEDIDASGSAAIPNEYACKMKRTNLLCAYKVLHKVTIKECNPAIKKYFIQNNIILPMEIPTLLEKAGLDIDVDYSKEPKLESKEFELFRTINHEVNPEIDFYSEGQTEILVDNRIANRLKEMKKRAEEIECEYS